MLDTIEEPMARKPDEERPLQLDQLERLTGKQLLVVIEKCQQLLGERKATKLQELRERWQAEAEEEGLMLTDLFPPAARAPRKAADGTRRPAELKYRLPSGKLWGGRGRLPLEAREALAGLEGFDPETGTFDPPELRAEALKRFLIQPE